MLILTRKRDESVVIGDNIIVTVVEIREDKVRLGFNAPNDVPIHREEIWLAIQRGEPHKNKDKEEPNTT